MSKKYDNAFEFLNNAEEVIEDLPELDQHYENRLRALHEFEDLVWGEVGRCAVSGVVGEEAIWMFTYWVEGEEYPYL